MALRKKLFTGMVALVAAGVFASAGAAQTTEEKSVDSTKKHEGRGMRHRDGFRKGEGRGFGYGIRGLRGIQLTDEQKTAIKAVHDANQPDAAVREEMRTIMQARRAGTITAEQTERAKQLHADARQKREMIELQIQNILTPEQRQQIETSKAEMKKRREERRQQRELRRTQQKTETTEKPAN